MGLTAASVFWMALATGLSVATFGPLSIFWLLLFVIGFILGAGVILFSRAKLKANRWIVASSHQCTDAPAVGLPKLIDELCREIRDKPKSRNDRRMTGSTAIDEVLHELLDYTYRDYIRTWYQRLSDDEEFQRDVSNTLQRVVVAFCERAKDVDLIPYITTRLVDDFASHIRLYRRSLSKIIEHRKDDTKPPADLESIFFDLETEMENNTICRDQICLSEAEELQYLRDVTEVLMFLLLPPGDFHNTLFRFIVREVVVSGILRPSIHCFSSPDFINRTVTWPCKDAMFNSDNFLTILRTSDNSDELQAVKERVDLEIARLRSKDTGGDDDTLIKQQLGSLLYVRSVCDLRQQQLSNGVSESDLLLPGDIGFAVAPGQKLHSLSFDVVCSNNVALSYFIEFMHGIGCDRYVYFYLAVEGYRVSAEQQISAAYLATGSDDLDRIDLEMLCEAAFTLYNQYLSEKASPRLQVDENTVRCISQRLDRGDITESLFDEAQARVWDTMREDPRYFEAFKKSKFYIKLLAELDLLQDSTSKPPDDPANLLFANGSATNANQRRSSLDDLLLGEPCVRLPVTESAVNCSQQPPPRNTFTLSANIANSGPCTEHGIKYTMYLISVMRRHSSGKVESWDVCRRYSDFHDFHMVLQEKFGSLSGLLLLPGKKTFDNMNKEFLEKRKIALNTYLQTLLNPSLLNTHRGLIEMVQQFLENMHWEQEKSDLAKKMDTLVNPLRSSVRNVSNIVRSMPDNFVDGVARVSGGFRNIPNNMLDGVGKMLNVKGTPFHNLLVTLLLPDEQATGLAPAIKAEILECGKVSASLDAEGDEDSIPLHIMLLLMDEVFDLKNRNQWLRRRIVAILQQIAKTMFGDSINRKIVEQVEHLTSSEQMADYLRQFRDTFWPGGTLPEPQPPRDQSTKMRTRVVCKAKLFGSLSEELRHLIGTETTRQGVMLVFNMFQHPRLNRRLTYVIFEGLLETIFADKCFPETFRKIHSRSPRVLRGTDRSKDPPSSSSSCPSLPENWSSSNLRKR